MCSEKALKPAQLRPRAEYLQIAFCVSERRASEVLTLSRTSHRYQSVADEQAAIRMRLKDLAQDRVSYGYRRLHILLQRGGSEPQAGLQAVSRGGSDAQDQEAQEARILSMPATTSMSYPPALMMPVSSTLVDAGPKPVYPFGATRTAGRVSYCTPAQSRVPPGPPSCLRRALPACPVNRPIDRAY